MRILILQHSINNPAGVYAEVVRERGASTTVVQLDEGEPMPPWVEFDGIIAMGGAMGANDDARYPWLTAEKRAIADAVHAGVPFWGACLGGQLLAASLGALVYRMSKPEIGFCPIELSDGAVTDPIFSGLRRPFAAFQWHHDAFELPDGGVHLGGSVACANQIFRWGDRAYGVQFHVEANVDMVQKWGDEPLVLDELRRHETKQVENGRILASRWIDMVRAGPAI
jgi:GMP synthase-like glutamine amidotransferase